LLVVLVQVQGRHADLTVVVVEQVVQEASVATVVQAAL
jgi:hypothetical protein